VVANKASDVRLGYTTMRRSQGLPWISTAAGCRVSYLSGIYFSSTCMTVPVKG
jgi:hypothetical protein